MSNTETTLTERETGLLKPLTTFSETIAILQQHRGTVERICAELKKSGQFPQQAKAIDDALEATQQSGLRPKRLTPIETNPEQSRDLYCIAPPIGRYDITEALGRWIVMLTDHCNMSRIIARCGGIDEAVTAMQDDFDTRMLEGMEYA